MGQRKGSHNIVLGPEQLGTLREVFDAVWDEVAPDYTKRLEHNRRRPWEVKTIAEQEHWRNVPSGIGFLMQLSSGRTT